MSFQTDRNTYNYWFLGFSQLPSLPYALGELQPQWKWNIDSALHSHWLARTLQTLWPVGTHCAYNSTVKPPSPSCRSVSKRIERLKLAIVNIVQTRKGYRLGLRSIPSSSSIYNLTFCNWSGKISAAKKRWREQQIQYSFYLQQT